MQDRNSTDKHIRIRKDQLNGLSLSYDYVRSINEPLPRNNIEQIICDLPSRAINKPLITELSRHTSNVHIITDNTSKLDRVAFSEDSSTTTIQKNVEPGQHEIKTVGDAKCIEELLKNNAPVVIEQILGPPNADLSNQNEWRYGTRGSLSVCVKGEHKGQFYNSSTGEQGGVIELIMGALEMSHKEAVSHAQMIFSKITPPPKQAALENGGVQSLANVSLDKNIRTQSLINQNQMNMDI